MNFLSLAMHYCIAPTKFMLNARLYFQLIKTEKYMRMTYLSLLELVLQSKVMESVKQLKDY